MTGMYSELPLVEQAIRTLAALILVSSFALLAQARVVATIQVFAWQGFLLAGCPGYGADPFIYICCAGAGIKNFFYTVAAHQAGQETRHPAGIRYDYQAGHYPDGRRLPCYFLL